MQPESAEIESVFDDDAAIDEALTEATKVALLQHKLAGNPVCVWQNGKVVWIKPEDIEI